MCASYKQITKTKRYTQTQLKRGLFSSKAHASTLNSNAKHRMWVHRVNDRQREENVKHVCDLWCVCICVVYLCLFEERTYAGSCNGMVFWMPLILNYMCFARLNESDCRRLFWATTTTEPQELEEEWEGDRSAKSIECDQTYAYANMCVRAVTEWRL